VVGLLWGAATGQWELSLGTAVFFELFWLDLFPAGTYIPPNSVLATLMTLALAHHFGVRGPEGLLLPLICSLPLGLLGARVEYWQRRWQDATYNALLHWARRSARRSQRFYPEKLVLSSVLQYVTVHFVLFGFLLLALIWLLEGVQGRLSPVEHLPLGWGHLWLLAAMGGINALRINKAYGLLAAGIGATALLHALGT
jgi:PTS system mannose-specific IIC component